MEARTEQQSAATRDALLVGFEPELFGERARLRSENPMGNGLHLSMPGELAASG